jgi:hypothetical protein
VPTDFGRIPIGPGALDQGTPGMAIAGLGHSALLTPRSTGIVRGCQAQRMPQLSRVIEAREVAQGCHRGHGDSKLDAPEGLESLNDRSQAPSVPLLVQFAFQPVQVFSLFGDCVDVFLKDYLLCRCGTDDLAEPRPVSRAPVGLPRVAG